jgi:hypothetical protein
MFKQAFVTQNQYRPKIVRLINWAWTLLVSTVGVVKTIKMKLFGGSDYQRWTNLENHLAWWASRTEAVARMVPEDTRVIEFGAGNRQLESLLPPSCSYVPSDLVDRGFETVVCDLNKRPLPDLSHLMVNVAVFVGVLEYVHDLPAITEWLSGQIMVCIASYHCIRAKRFSLRRLKEMFLRAYHGYLSYYTEKEIVALFKTNGFVCARIETWRDQELFVFSKENPSARLSTN